MNQQARRNIDSGDTFESAIAQLLERIRKTKWARSQLDVIVADGLKVANKIDTDYDDDESFSLFKLYLLYKVAFEVWSYQHQAILESLKDNKNAQFTNNSQLVLHHQNVVMNMFDELEKLANVNDPDRLRNIWLSVWRQTLLQLAEFVDIPIVPPVKSKKPNLFGFSLRMKLPALSPDTKFAILATCLLVLAIVMATLLLIRN